MGLDSKATKKSSIADRMANDEHFRQAYQHHLRGELEQAAEFYIRSIEAQPSPAGHTFLAKVLGELGETEAAIEECKLALDLDPEFGSANNDLGAYLLDSKKYGEAEKFLLKACTAEDYENREFPHFNLARYYLHKGMLKKAEEELSTAISINPAFAPAQQFLARVQAQIH